MEIYLLRHGEAHAKARTDEERELTSTGAADTENVIRQFLQRTAERDSAPAKMLVLVSPLRRAQQTAALVAKHLAESESIMQADFEICDLITPTGRCEQILDFLQSLFIAATTSTDAVDEGKHSSLGLLHNGLSDNSAIMLVSHNPFLSELLNLLVNEAGQMRRGLSTSELASINCTIPAPGVGTLRYILSPGG